MSASLQSFDRRLFGHAAAARIHRSGAEATSGKGYLVFVWAAVALGAVAIIEPSPGDIGIALLLIAGFLSGNLKWGKELAFPLMFLILFLLSNLISLCYAVEPAEGALFLGITLFMLMTWLFAIGLLTRFQVRAVDVLMSGYSFGGVVSSVVAVLCYFGFLPLGEIVLFYDRIKGFFKDPNVFGPYLVISAVYAIHRLQSRHCTRAQQVWWWCACISSSVGVLLCFSRAAWANFALTLFAFFALNGIANRADGSLRRNIVYFVAILAILGATLAYAMTIPQVAEVIAYRTEMQSYDEDRFATHEAAMELGIQNPLGVGPGQSFAYLNYATHSLYLRLFSENGAIGVVSLLAFMLLTLVRCVWLSQTSLTRVQRSLFSLVAAAIFGTLINSFAIDTLHWRHYWLLLALGWMPVWANNALDDSTASERAKRRQFHRGRGPLEGQGANA